jgi:hypothetical protein
MRRRGSREHHRPVLRVLLMIPTSRRKDHDRILIVPGYLFMARITNMTHIIMPL